MNTQELLVLGLIVASAVLLISGRLRADLTALLLLTALGLTGLIPPENLFTGFSNKAVITILALFIITAGLERTGVAGRLGRLLGRVAGHREGRVVLTLMLATALLSLVMNTIAAAAVLLPAAMSLSRQAGLSPARLLIPLSFGSLLGGMVTLFTTANILVSSALVENGLPGYGMLDFVPVGLPMAAAGMAFMILLGRRWLPKGGKLRPERTRDVLLAEIYGLGERVFAVVVGPDSVMAGLTLAEGRWNEELGLKVIALSRGGQVHLAPGDGERVLADDVILFTGFTDVTEMARYGLTFTVDPAWKGQFTSAGIGLAEVILAPRSVLAGRSLAEMRFRDQYDLSALVLWREGQTIREGVAELPLRFGDALLLFGRLDKIALLRRDPDFIILEEDSGDAPPPFKAWLAVVFSLAAVLLPACNLWPIAESTFAAAVLMVLCGCLNMDQAYAAVDWKTIFMIAGILPLGTAILTSGFAALLGEKLIHFLGGWGPLALAGGLYAGTLLLTQVMSGQATAVVLAPVAIAAARHCGVDPRGLALAVALGCSTAFLTPFSHASNMLVMGPGGYTIKDYFRVGLPLTLVLGGVFTVSLAVFWNFG